jgi:hypothetical protein
MVASVQTVVLVHAFGSSGRCSRQAVATHGNGFGLISRFRGVPICDRLPPVATTRLHKGSIVCSLLRQRTPFVSKRYSLAWTLAQRAPVKWGGGPGPRRAANTAILRNKATVYCRCARLANVVI